MMKIREFQEEDSEAVINLWNRCGLAVPWNDSIKDINRKLLIQKELFLVGLIGEKVVASVMGGYDGHRGWINYLAVDPDFQKQGLGILIMNEVEERITRKGCPKINLQIRETNKKVIEFYQSIGYTIDPVVSMGKRLIKD